MTKKKDRVRVMNVIETGRASDLEFPYLMEVKPIMVNRR